MNVTKQQYEHLNGILKTYEPDIYIDCQLYTL